MTKAIIVMGDIEMGGGTITDDFISDKLLVQVIDNLSNKNISMDLVLNGDTFDFLKCPTMQNTYPKHIDVKTSISKLQLIYKAHKEVFEAFKRFAARGKHIYFLPGNHDQDIAFPTIQTFIRKKIGKRVHFPALCYNKNGIHVEHGHRHDTLNRVDKLFAKYLGRKILNLPFASIGVITSFVKIKEIHPFMERIHPIHTLLKLHPTVLRKLTKAMILHLGEQTWAYLRNPKDPLVGFTPKLFKELLNRWWNVNWDVTKALPHIHKSLKKKPRLTIAGHKHEYFVSTKTASILPDTWRDEYRLDARTGRLRPKKKNYVSILVQGNTLRWRVVSVTSKRSTWKLSDVAKNELAYLKKAAKEEGANRPAV